MTKPDKNSALLALGALAFAGVVFELSSSPVKQVIDGGSAQDRAIAALLDQALDAPADLVPPVGQCQVVTVVDTNTVTYSQEQICTLPDAGVQGLPAGVVTVDSTASTATALGPVAVALGPDGGPTGLNTPSVVPTGCACAPRANPSSCIVAQPRIGQVTTFGPGLPGIRYDVGMWQPAGGCIPTPCYELSGYTALAAACQ